MAGIREASPSDGPALVRFFLETPLVAGTAFVLDRSPDFAALLRLRGQARTFIASRAGRIVGAVTALRHEGYDGAREITIGEVADLRVAPTQRGGRLVSGLLAAAREALASDGADWVLCLIGERNQDARRLTAGKAGFPALAPLGRYASSHFIAVRVPLGRRASSVRVRPAGPADAPALRDLAERLSVHRRFRPREPLPWPDPAGQHRAWIATDAAQRPLGALVVWDGMEVRRIRVIRYGAADRLLAAALRMAALAGAATPLPPAGGALRLWASRWLGAEGSAAEVVRALVRTAVRDAAAAGQHVLQLNLAADDPLQARLPALPRSVYWTTVYGAPLARSAEVYRSDERMCFADLALV